MGYVRCVKIFTKKLRKDLRISKSCSTFALAFGKKVRYKAIGRLAQLV